MKTNQTIKCPRADDPFGIRFTSFLASFLVREPRAIKVAYPRSLNRGATFLTKGEAPGPGMFAASRSLEIAMLAQPHPMMARDWPGMLAATRSLEKAMMAQSDPRLVLQETTA